MSKIDDIDRQVMAGAANISGARLKAMPGTRPYVTEVGQRQAEGLRDENARLKAERAEGGVVLLLDPKTVRASKFSNRDGQFLKPEDEEFAAFKGRIHRFGQLQPISVHPLKEAAPYEWEIVYGHRRHAVCLLLDAELSEGYKLKALVDAKAEDEQYALQAWYGENADRKGVSAYEYGARLSEALKAGVFASQQELAKNLALSASDLSHFLSLLEFPEEIFAAYGDRHVIRTRHIRDLNAALSDNRARVLEVAKRLATKIPKLPPADVFRALVGKPSQVKRARGKTRVTIERKGRVAMTVMDLQGRLSLKLGATLLSRPGAPSRFSAHMKKAAEQFVDEEFSKE